MKSLLAFHLFFAYDKTQMALTRRQKEVLDFIASYQVEKGYSPSYEEIARGLELASIATVHKHISALQTKNYLHRSHNQSRSVEIGSKVSSGATAQPRTPVDGGTGAWHDRCRQARGDV